METRPVFQNLSPLDHRYYEANRELFDELSTHLSEAASVRYCTLVEAALTRAHLRRLGLDSEENISATEQLSELVTPDDVYEEERVTRHNIRALVRVIKRHLPDDVAALVHVGATSVDILDTSMALRVREATTRVVIPSLIRVVRELTSLIAEHADSIQIGRTHGQHGVPITFGFAFAEYVSRLGKSVERITDLAKDLRGKVSGAVGAFNSTSMVTSNPQDFERSVLADIGLTPADHATQMVQPEYLLRLLLEMNIAFGILANLADDLRNLQRTEIDELREGFAKGQVGSSTMPQKRNPWNSEHVKSLWKAFSPRIMSFYADQISEHQRDLTNSASNRFVADYIAGLTAASARMESVLKSLFVNTQRMRENAAMTGDMALAEAAYTLLATVGVSDAHERIRRATLAAEEHHAPLVDVLKGDEETWALVVDALARVSDLAPAKFFSDPSHYTGQSAAIARGIAAAYTTRMDALAFATGASPQEQHSKESNQ